MLITCFQILAKRNSLYPEIAHIPRILIRYHRRLGEGEIILIGVRIKQDIVVNDENMKKRRSKYHLPGRYRRVNCKKPLVISIAD